jgi:beta-aspartyl-peptidase (threonine type)
MNDFSLMIHGGVGGAHDAEPYESSLRRVAEAGARLLEEGASALDAVAQCVVLLEDDPLFNAGRGSALNVDGEALLDASIMDGSTLAAGAAASLRGVRNPVLLARAIMERSDHVFLIGEGAAQFARESGLALASAEYFVTEARVKELEEAKRRRGAALDQMQNPECRPGTVGAVARDKRGNLAAATSTGGVTNAARGRVGDSPVIGAGTYADNLSCAVSCTGVGEDFLRTALARTAASLVEHRGLNAASAADAAIQLLVDRVNGLGGLIIVDHNGECAHAHSTRSICVAWVRNGEIKVRS